MKPYLLNEKTGELSIVKGGKVVAKTATQLKNACQQR